MTLSLPARLKSSGWVLHLAVAATVLALVLHGFGGEQVFAHLGDVHLGWASVAVALSLVDGVVRVLNWRQLLGDSMPGRTHLRRRLFASYYSGSFLGTVVPSTAGTDALRAMFATQSLGGHMAFHIGPLFTLNVLGLAAGCVVGEVGVLALWGASTGPTRWFLATASLLLGALITAAATGYLLLKYRRGWAISALRLAGPRLFPVRRMARRFLRGLVVFTRSGVHFAPVFGVAMLTQVVRAATFMAVAAALGLQLPLAAWLLLAPLTTLSALLPLSVAGFGGEQAALVYLLAPFAVDASQAVAVSLAFSTLWLAVNVIYGGAAYLLSARVLGLSRPPAAAGVGRTSPFPQL